jgi:hypothetical protein
MSNSVTRLKSKPQAPIELSKDFDHARKCLAAAKGYVQQGAGFMLLAGVELRRLKKLHGVKRGGDRKSDQTRRGSGLIGWNEICERELGITDDTANKYILMAESAKERVKVLKDLEEKLLSTPFMRLTEAERAKVTKSVSKLCDGQTGKEVMQALGIAKADPGSNLGKDRNKGGNSTASKLTPEEEAQEHFRPAICTLMGLRLDDPRGWLKLLHYLPLEREGEETVHERISLRDASEELTVWKESLEKALKSIAKAMHGIRKPDAAARLQDARSLVMKEAGLADEQEDSGTKKLTKEGAKA